MNDGGKYGERWLKRKFNSVEIETRDLNISFDRNAKRQHRTSNFVSESELSKYRYYHSYMYERKLTDDIIELFDIGYDAETDCLTFPIRDINGNCIFVARRSVKTKFFNYPKEIEKPVYGLYELHHVLMSEANPSWALHELRAGNAKEVIVCESMLDALTCWVYGKYAVALNGTGNDLQFKQLSDLQCRKLILATDKDEAGMKARDRLRNNIKNKIITEYDTRSYPEGAKDINDMSKEEFLALQEIF
jgi:DNA primase